MSEAMATTASLSELISVCQKLEKEGQYKEIECIYREWIAANSVHPHLHLVHFNHACQLTALGRQPEAIQSLAAALKLKPEFLHAHVNLGWLLSASGGHDNALRHWQKVSENLSGINGETLQLKILALRNTAKLLLDHRRFSQAESVLQQLVKLDPHQRDVMEQLVGARLAQCLSPILHDLERKTFLRNINPLSLIYLSDDPWMQLGLAADYARYQVKNIDDLHTADRRAAAINLKGRRLRVGYVSSDLHDHAVGALLVELFELHDNTLIELFAYYCGNKASGDTHKRFKIAAEHWIDITSMTNIQAAAQIASDGIDILVDVNGYTRDARAEIFARRPAPVIVNWLGYPGTLGTAYHQYIIADDWIIPKGSEHYYSEKVLHLPCYQPNDRKRVVASPPTRSEAGLPEQGFIFCCFNAAQKLTRLTLARWATILEHVPDSSLWLLDDGPEMRANITAFMESKGIAAKRLIFAPKLSHAKHLARYVLADLFLDSFPYGAHTTGSDALWMGVPVLTLSGRNFASRVCGSLVRAAGLPEMAVETPEAYTQRAIALALNPAELDAIRARLIKGRDNCTLFDMPRLARSLENLFQMMAAKHQKGQTPQPDLTNLTHYLTAGCNFNHEVEDMLTRSDYNDAYRSQLARQHASEPLPKDSRLWKSDQSVTTALSSVRKITGAGVS